jgi:prepilin-type N-terminal cleavage/methylation domain-containing protein
MRKGFTGIELMIVISIISLISAIALPKFSNIRSESKIANVSGNLANLNTAISLYNVKNGSYPDLVGNEDDLGDFIDVYSKSKMPDTPSYSGGSKSNTVYSSRSNTGGWLYMETDGVIYANLEDGTYSGDADTEIWSGESETSNSILYDFDDDDGLIFDSGTWAISEDGTLYSTGGWNGYVFMENPYSEYTIDITATLLDINNGYGLFIQSDEDGSGYILQFDWGLNAIVIKERDSYGSEISSSTQNILNGYADGNEYMDVNDEDYDGWWTDEHDISVSVTSNGDGTNSVSVSIDGEDITDEDIIIDESTSDTNYTGFRSWGDVDVEVESLEIIEI